MALHFAGQGLSITSQAFPPSLAVIEGGDLLNLTFSLNYNGTEGGLFENSTACEGLRNSSVFLELLITLPIVFDIVSPKNQINHTGSIITDFSNCSFVPSLDINSSFATDNVHGFNVIKYNIFSQNLSWTAIFDVRLKLRHSAKVDSIYNITANATFLNETRQVNVASYGTTVPGDLRLEAESTSILETPGVTLTSEEEITLLASFRLPRLTANLKLLVMLPTFGNSTPMRFLSGIVFSLSEGIESQFLSGGSPAQLSISPSTSHLFPYTKNLAEFAFGETVNNADDVPNGTITVKVYAVVDTSQGAFLAETDGNVTCVLMYDSPRGLNTKAEEVLLTLRLDQPLMEYHFDPVLLKLCCFQGKEIMDLAFEVRNPDTSTAPALNISIDISVPSVDIKILSFSVELCSNSSCTDLKGTNMLTNSSSGLTVELPRLNSSSWVHGNLSNLIRPSVAAGSSHGNYFTLEYTRKDWLPMHTIEKRVVGIRKVIPYAPVVISTNVPHPTRDLTAITIGEDVVLRIKLNIPVSTNANFTIKVSGRGYEGIAGQIIKVGRNLESLDQQIVGAGLNVSGSSLSVNLGTVVNHGNFSQSSDNEIEYQATIRAEDSAENYDGESILIVFGTTINGNLDQTSTSTSLQLIEPHILATVTVDKTTEVQANYDLTFTVQLRHAVQSSSPAFRLLLEIAAPHEYFTNVREVGSPNIGDLSVVAGNQAPSGNPRYDNSNTKVLVVRIPNELALGQTATFQYKAKTVSNLLPSIYVSSPAYLSYVSLPPSLAPREGRKYERNTSEAEFLTYRPEPFVTVTFKAPTGSFDSGDRVKYDLTLKNTDQTTTAYSLTIVATFHELNTSKFSVTCSRGSPKFNATYRESKLSVSTLTPSQTISCNYVSYLLNDLSPKQSISQVVAVEYYSTNVGNNPQNVASYKEKRFANLTTKPINATIQASQNALTLQAGDPVNFTVLLRFPECKTNLTVVIDMPTVPASVIDLSRRRRGAAGLEISSEIGIERSRIKRSTGLVYALAPVLNDSYVKLGDGLTVLQSPSISQVNLATLNIAFGSVSNLPGSGPNNTIEIFLKFTTANNPLVLSGRLLRLTALLRFDAGTDAFYKEFLIVGPLLKPLLSILKTVKIFKGDMDSPLVLFNLTVSHANGSLYDAADVTVTDATQGMDYYKADVSTKGAFVTYPKKNHFGVQFTLRSLRVGDTRSFIYVGQFKVSEKEPETMRIPAEVSWKSVQLNSPIYRVKSDTGTACLQRDNVDKPEKRKVFGYFALGVLLGLLIGAVIAAILVLVILKCCDKGKMAPYYTRFTNTTTMTCLTGGSQYIYHGGELPDSKPVETHKETSIVQTDESIVPILTLDNASQTEKELNSLDIQSTAALDADLEFQRQNMFIRALKLLARKLRVKREISSDQEKKFGLQIKQAIGAVAFKMAAEYKRKSAELRKRLQKDGKSRLDALHREQRKEREETENKIKGLVNEREKRNILELLKRRQEAQAEELKQNLKLEQDVEMEKLRKEVSISRRFALKESQNKLIQNLIKDAKLNEEQASAIIKNHLSNMAAIDKATDEERARRVMALEMRLAERRALARQKQEEEERKKQDLNKLDEGHSEALQNLVRSSNLSAEDASAYIERYRKEVEVVDNKLAKDRKRQELKLHQKLTALKQRRIEEKAREHQRQIKEFEDQQDEKFEQVEIDTVAAISEKQKMLQKHRQEIEEIERNSDREAAEEIEALRDQQTRDGNQMIKTNAQKMYQELVNKGLSESEKEAILERHMADLAMQQEAREQERRRQRELLEKRLEKQRASLEKKMKEEQDEQAEIRKQEDKIVGDLIVNQVAMSEEERDRIIQEHEKNLAELESSLTLNKLRQRQMLEEKLAQRKKRRMEQLEQKHMSETKDRDYSDKILVEGEDIEMIKKHEQEKMAAMKEDEIQMEDEMEKVREEMLAERSKKLEEHHEKLGAIIAKLQIEKAKQISKIAMQQQALGQLQAGLVDELESKGTFQDPETQKIMEKYQKDTKNLEENLKLQKEKQEKALRERLQQRMKQREESLVLQQKDELSQYMSNLNVNNTAMKLRKAAVKARHQKELNDLSTRMQKEIDQSINEMKMTSDIKRMQAVEEQNIKLISILVKQGKLKEEELESVLKFLFPTKTSSEIDEFLSRIYGPAHTKDSKQTLLDPRRESTLEARIRRASFAHGTSPPPISKPSKKKKKSKKKEQESDDLPPVKFKGSRKGFNLNESLRGYRSLADEEQNAFGTLPRVADDERDVTRGYQTMGSYKPLTEDNNQELVDEMFGDSPEKTRKKSGKKRRRRPRDDDDETVP